MCKVFIALSILDTAMEKLGQMLSASRRLILIGTIWDKSGKLSNEVISNR